jgi:hypothetical protein
MELLRDIPSRALFPPGQRLGSKATICAHVLVYIITTSCLAIWEATVGFTRLYTRASGELDFFRSDSDSRSVRILALNVRCWYKDLVSNNKQSETRLARRVVPLIHRDDCTRLGLHHSENINILQGRATCSTTERWAIT